MLKMDATMDSHGAMPMLSAKLAVGRLALLGCGAILIAVYILQPPIHMHSSWTSALWSPALLPLRVLASIFGLYGGAVSIMLVVASLTGRDAMLLRDGEVKYFNPYPHRLSVSQIKRAYSLPKRKLVVMETDSKKVFVSTWIFSRQNDAELMVDSINSALSQSPA